MPTLFSAKKHGFLSNLTRVETNEGYIKNESRAWYFSLCYLSSEAFFNPVQMKHIGSFMENLLAFFVLFFVWNGLT